MPTPNTRSLGMGIWNCVLRIIAAALMLGACIPAHCVSKRRFTVRDSIAMVRFSDTPHGDSSDVAHFSPDGTHFVVVTSRGIIHTDQIESSIWIFTTKQVLNYVHRRRLTAKPRPQLLARVATVPRVRVTVAYGPVIWDVRWSADSRSLYFLGENRDGERHVYTVAMNSPLRLRDLTPGAIDVTHYDVGHGELVYKAFHLCPPSVSSNAEMINADARVVTGDPLQAILFPGESDASRCTELWVVRNHHTKRIETNYGPVSPQDQTYPFDVLSISFSGRFAITLMPVQTVDSSWATYEEASDVIGRRIAPSDPRTTSPWNPLRLRQYELIDLSTAKVVPLKLGPYAETLGYEIPAAVKWSATGQSAFISNTFLPVMHSAGMENKNRFPCQVAELDIATRAVRCVTGSEDRRASDEGHAERMPRSMPNKSELEINCRQDLNDPPILWATDRATGSEALLWNPNPQLSQIALGRAIIYRWKDKTGNEWKGALVEPPGLLPGHRYPLVIQVYELHDHQFLTDGIDPTAMPARALAGAGILYLQVERRPALRLSESDASEQVEGMRSAVESLAKAGIVDPQKIGLIGFSWSCWYVETALIDHSFHIAAATIADGIDNSYMQFHLWGDSTPAIAEQFTAINGGSPFGAGLRRWLKTAPGFHLSAVTTPLRIAAIGPMSILGEWEIYSSLHMQHKPVDMIYFPSGQHSLQKPLERLASEQGDLDWFRFWLLEHHGSACFKPAEYQRWSSLATLTGSYQSK